jgi:hypothetical protein
LIGEPSDHSAPLGGTAHVFARSGVTWTEEATLRASDAAINDQFGQGASLSADGSRALIGVQGDDGDQGSGRLFVRTGTTWTASVTLVASDRVVESLGISAALSADGTRAALGTFTSSAPRVKVFVLAGP